MVAQFGTMEVIQMPNPPAMRRYRLCLLLLALAIVAVSATVAAWTSEDLEPAEKDYRSAYLYYAGAQYWKAENVQPSYTSIPIQPNYAGYMSYPVDHLNDRAHIESAALTLIARNSGTFTLNVKVMEREFHELDPVLGMTTIWKASSAGSVTVSTGLAYRTYTFDITGTSLDRLRDVVSGDDTYLVIAFESSSLGFADVFPRYVDLSGTYYSTLTLEYDDEAPGVPILGALDSYVKGDSVSISWSTSDDLPTGGNVSGVTYQVGLYLPGAPAENPYHTTSWLDGTSWDLTSVVDGIEYTFRVRSRDASGFASDWSSLVNTTVDNSPPTAPVIAGLPPFMSGHWLRVAWYGSVDAGVGNITYQLMVSEFRHFPMEYIHVEFTQSNTFEFTDILDGNVTYYFRVRAIDDLGHASAYSPIEQTLLDFEPPTAPEPVALPEFTEGTSCVLSWFPAFDGGSGVSGYGVDVATTPGFVDGTIVYHLSTDSTHVWVDGLEDDVTYYYRVRASDRAQYLSDWSEPVHSTQDASPPTAPAFHAIPEFVPGGPLTLTWDPAIDRGSGVSHYELWRFPKNLPGSFMVIMFVDVVGQSITFPELSEGPWGFGLRAVDRLGHSGPSDNLNTTVDTTQPTVPEMVQLPEYSNGTSVWVSWSESTDPSGIDHYTVHYWQYGYAAFPTRIDTRFPGCWVYNLLDGVKYVYKVRATDGVGNWITSNNTMSTQDASPPPTPALYPHYSIVMHDSTSVQWSPVTDASGGRVEYKLSVFRSYMSEWTESDYPWTEETNLTVEGLLDSGAYEFRVTARDPFGWQSMPSEPITFLVDLTPPLVKVLAPAEGEVVSGTVTIHSQMDDEHPWGYFMQYRPSDGEEWEYIVYWTEMHNPPWSFVSWDTSGLPDGDYVVRVTHVDGIGLQGFTELNVTLANAKISVSPSDIILYEGTGSPTAGVVVRNIGGVAAKNLSVEIYDDGKLLDSADGVIIKGNSFFLFTHELEGEGRHTVSVRVRSDLYDTGEVVQTLDVEEDEGSVSVSSPVAWVGVLAIVLSVVAIALNLAGRRGSGPAARGREEDAWVESG